MTQRAAFLIATSLATACSAQMPRSAPASAPVLASAPAPSVAPPAAGAAPRAEHTGFTDVNTDNSLVSNGSVAASSEHLLPTASAFRREVYRLGGRVYAEQLHYRELTDDSDRDETGASAAGSGPASSATYRIKILPRLLPDLLDWLGTHATITSQDVSSIIAMESEADASIVRPDVRARLAEIDAQLADLARDAPERAALEEERAKLVGATEADPNALADNTKRVAVLDVRLDAPRPPDPYAHGTVVGTARASVVDIGAFGAGSTSRIGGGMGVGGHSPVSTLEVIGYAADDMAERAGVTATLGFGTYAKAFGGGHGAVNPYVGARFGYAYLGASYVEVAAEVGVELYKQRGVVWTVSARPMGLIGGDSKTALEVGSSLGLSL